METNNGKLILYTSQSDIVINTLEKEDLYLVKKEFIEKKYDELSSIFLAAYNWFIMKAPRYVEKPRDARYPIWLFTDPRYVEKYPGSKIIRLEVDLDQVILFSAYKWNRIQNLAYLEKDEEDLASFQAELKRQGIAREQDIYLTSFYPLLKQRVVKSWDRLFEEDIDPDKDYQAALWQIEKKWILSID